MFARPCGRCGVVLVVVLAGCTTAAQRPSQAPQNAEPTLWLVDHAAMMQASALAQAAEQQGRFSDAAGAWERAAAASRSIPSPTGIGFHVDAARASMRAGDAQRALRLLQAAADDGYWYDRSVEGDEAFKPLVGTDRFQSLLLQFRHNATAYQQAHNDPDKARLVFTDVERFWQAYDLALQQKDARQKADIFQRHHLLGGSPGLIDYHRIKTGSVEKLVETLERFPDYYKGVRAQTLKAAALEGDIRNGLRRLKALHPQGAVPDVTFVIGRLNSGGTAGPSGMLVGLDIWSWTPGVSVEGLSSGMTTLVTTATLSQLPFVVVHEHVHTLQQYAGPPTLLSEALSEGSADFLAGLALPEQARPYYYQWGLEHEAEVWRRFAADMDKQDTSAWIANLNHTEDGWSADLGYFVGARICEAYHARADNKRKAIEDLLYVTNATAILETSGYAQRFSDREK